MQTQRVIENVHGRELAAVANADQEEHVENMKDNCKIDDSTCAIRSRSGVHGERNPELENWKFRLYNQVTRWSSRKRKLSSTCKALSFVE